MKIITKDNKGITLIALIITVIITLILISVTTYTGINTYKNAQVTKFITQMQLVQGKVDELKESEDIEALITMGEAVPAGKQIIITTACNNGELTDYNIDSYRFFSLKNMKEQLDLAEGITGEIMINFTTREVVSTIGVRYEDKIHYTQYLLPNAQTIIHHDSNNSINRNLNFNVDITINGLNANIEINGDEIVEIDGVETLKEKGIEITNATLSYKEQAETYWKNITNYTEKGETYSTLISKSGTYQFKIKDNTTGVESEIVTKNLILTNKPKTNTQINPYNYSLTSENWAYITDSEGDNYVWVPRFVYKTDDNDQNVIKFIKGNSSITTDNSSIDETWTIPDKFTSEDGVELTGIWVKVTSKNQAGIDIVDLLKSNITVVNEF